MKTDHSRTRGQMHGSRAAVMVAAATLLCALPAFAVEPADCLQCHDQEELTGRSTAELMAALADKAIPPHGRFAGITEAEIDALIKAFSDE